MILEGLAPCKGMRIQESRKYLLVESGIFGFKIQHTGQGIRILLKIGIRNLLLAKGIQLLECAIFGVESRIQDCLGFLYVGTRGSLLVTTSLAP